MKTITVIGRGKDAKLLAKYLDCDMNLRKADVAIRYGSRRVAPRYPIVINDNEAVANASNKYYSLRIFKEHGIPVPKHSQHLINVGYPALGRKFYHRKGMDIKYLESADRLPDNWQSDYYVQFIPVQSEFRIHVAFGEVISIAVKCDGDSNTYCRNLNTGWIFKESLWRWKKECKELPSLGIKAVKSLGLDFGSVDIIVSKDGKPYILEVNTASGLIDRRAELYANHILKFIKSKKEVV